MLSLRSYWGGLRHEARAYTSSASLPILKENKMKDIIGKKFGLLTVKSFLGYKNRRPFYLVVCDCGKEKEVCYWELVRGDTKSCGCLHKKLLSERAKTHGDSKTRLYKIWLGIKKRCLDKNSTTFMYYGGRGINLCDDWLDYSSFKKWSLENCYKENLSIDRIDNNGNYTPKNCRWVDKKEQANNRRTNHFLEYKGEKRSMMDWCRKLGLNYNKVRSRINSYHWTVEEAFER